MPITPTNNRSHQSANSTPSDFSSPPRPTGSPSLGEPAKTDDAHGSREKTDSYDQRLQHARALDWRFLLPSPRFQDVLLVEGQDPSLRQALQEQSASLDLYDALQDRQRQYSLVVCEQLAADNVAHWAPSIASRGSLVGFVHRPPSHNIWRSRIWWNRQMRCVRQTLSKWGNFETAWWWNVPCREQCQTLIPIQESDLIQTFLTSKLPRWCPSFAARALVRTNAFYHRITDATLVARRVD